MLISIRKQFRNQKGFTLVELMVVIAILGILAAIAVPKVTGSTESAKDAKVMADLRTLDASLAMYFTKNGNYPTSNDLEALKPDFIGQVPKPPDGRGDAYTYAPVKNGASYKLSGMVKGKNSAAIAQPSPGSDAL